MNIKVTLSLLTTLCFLFAVSPIAFAQPETETDTQTEAASETETDTQTETASETDDFFDDFDALDFVPLEDFEEGLLEQISPLAFFPYLELNGLFRVRSQLNVNLDLDTAGTSAVLPPVETYVPVDTPADPDKNTLWGTNLRLRLEPTLHITENLRVHVEADLLRNAVFGSMPRYQLNEPGQPAPDHRLMSASQRRMQDILWVNEAYGELQTFFGLFRAGRMDNHWGLGMFANDGDCLQCDYGDNIDRLMYQTSVFGYNLMAAIDFPNEGWVPRAPGFRHGQPYDMGQIDEANQYTLAVFDTPQTRPERELQMQRLIQQRLPVFNWGVYFSYRSQTGAFIPDVDGFEQATPDAPPTLVYRGLQAYTTDLWLQFLYQPSANTSMRIELEGIGILGSVDNATANPVGFATNGDADQPQRLNCFDEQVREANPTLCTTDAAGQSTSRNIRQFGLALESEFHIGGPVGFGLNGGFANGGSTPNWGYGALNGPALNFYRFNPDYHVDLILFRQIIGTVTNAYYVNPYAVARFLETGNQRMELQLDAIASRAFNTAGTPSGESPWIGLEFDAALRFIRLNTFQASLEGGILFPFGALNAVTDRDRLIVFGDNPPTFGENQSASLAWTLQANLFWEF